MAKKKKSRKKTQEFARGLIIASIFLMLINLPAGIITLTAALALYFSTIF